MTFSLWHTGKYLHFFTITFCNYKIGCHFLNALLEFSRHFTSKKRSLLYNIRSSLWCHWLHWHLVFVNNSLSFGTKKSQSSASLCYREGPEGTIWVQHFNQLLLFSAGSQDNLYTGAQTLLLCGQNVLATIRTVLMSGTNQTHENKMIICRWNRFDFILHNFHQYLYLDFKTRRLKCLVIISSSGFSIALTWNVINESN